MRDLLQQRQLVGIIAFGIEDRDAGPQGCEPGIDIAVEQEAVHDIGLPFKNCATQAAQDRKIELVVFLIRNQIDPGALELRLAGNQTVQGVDGDRVSSAGELLGKLHQLLFGAAEPQLADYVENPHCDSTLPSRSPLSSRHRMSRRAVV
jgi:hypothetical protein